MPQIYIFTVNFIVADMLMEAFETKSALESYIFKPNLYFRYVDETFII